MSAFPANLWSLGWELSNDFSCIISPEGKTLLWFFHLMFSPGNCYERMLFLELSRQVLYMIWKTKKKKNWHKALVNFSLLTNDQNPFLRLDIFKWRESASICSWAFALCGVLFYPASGKSVKSISHTVEQPWGSLLKYRGLFLPGEELLESQHEPVGLFNKGKECLEDKTLHSFPGKCLLYIFAKW